MKLHHRIFLSFMLGVVLLLSVIAVVIYGFQKSELVSALDEKVRITEQSVMRTAKSRRQGMMNAVKTIAEDWDSRRAIDFSNTATVASALSSQRKRVHAEEAVFFGRDGSIVGSRPTTSPDLTDVSKRVLHNDSFVPYQLIRIDGAYHHFVLSEVRAPQKIGWLGLTYRTKDLDEIVTDASGQADMIVLVYDTTTSPEVVTASPDIQRSTVSDILALSTNDSLLTREHRMLGDNEVIAQFVPLQEGSKTYLAVVGLTRSTFATLERFWHRMALLFVVFAVLSVFTTYITAQNITRPLQLLLSNAKQLEDGDFSTSVDIDRNDEIGDLAVAFRQMQEAVFERRRKAVESMQQLEYQASHDVLTGLANRRSLTMQLEVANQSVTDEQGDYCICMLDLDRFKIVNDTSGHAAGDALLVKIGALLRESVYSTDTIVRLGGDEFAILLRDCKASVAVRICNQIRKKIEEIVFHWDGDSHRIGASIGVLSVSTVAADISEVLQRADAACFAAKEGGRNQVYLVEDTSPAVDEQRKELHWVHRLHTAIDNDQLLLYAQPIVPLQSASPDTPERMEVLVRLRNYATGKLVPPGAFVPSAERYGLSTKIDRWVLTQLIKMTSIYNQVFAENRTYWVNLSGSSLGDETFVDFLESIVSRNLLPPGSLNFEITETAIIRNINEASAVMYRLKELGCQFALDDFGVGLSSFSYLKSLPVDYLKIDGMFVRNIAEDKIDRLFVKSIIDIAHAMDIKTIAEFVEDQSTLDAVTALGADYGQGFALGKPRELMPQLVNQEAI